MRYFAMKPIVFTATSARQWSKLSPDIRRRIDARLTEFAMTGTTNTGWVFIAAVLATTSAMLVEGPKIPQLDDDLLMQVVPMALLTLAARVLR